MSDYLMRFEDGPMSKRHNIPTAAGTTGNAVVPDAMFAWPLPDRLGILCHEGVQQVAFWNADDVEAAELPVEITDSPNAVIYRKVSQSELSSDVKGVLRGAQYRLEA